MKKLLPNFRRVLELSEMRGYDKGHSTITMSREGLHKLFQELIARFDFDEEFYLSKNPDVAEGVKSGKIESGYEHYIHFGYFEGRLPHMNGFEPIEYVQKVPELGYLRESDQEELAAVAESHFISKGYADGLDNK